MEEAHDDVLGPLKAYMERSPFVLSSPSDLAQPSVFPKHQHQVHTRCEENRRWDGISCTPSQWLYWREANSRISLEIRGAETIMHGFLSLPRECIGAHEVLRDESHNASEGGIYPLKHSGSGSLIDFGIGIQVESEDDVINGHLGTKPRKSGR